MKINEVMKETGLTKKSIYYYENEGLIGPKKDPWNNYRIYTHDDVRKLIQINILRRLDVPIKSIGDIIEHEIPVKEILKKQLVLTNQKINNLYRNKIIMNELIVKDIDARDFSSNTLKEYNRKLDNLMEEYGRLGEEIVRLFPGTLGKLLSIFYSDFLNVPLDTEEKLSAWKELIKKLDDISEVEYPEDIKRIVDELYNEVEHKNQDFYNNTNGHHDTFSREQFPPILKENLGNYTIYPMEERNFKGYYELQNFILNNLSGFQEIGFYIRIINERYQTAHHERLPY